MQVRRDTAANWITVNPVLASGEIGYETDTGYLKVGNGTSAWTALPYTPSQYMVLSSANTLTSQTAAQPIFDGGGGTSNGALTLVDGTYTFECMFSLTSMSATSGSFGFALAGTATNTHSYMALGQDAALATATTIASTFNTAANTTLCIASTSTTGYAFIKGIIRVTAAGTIIPSVSLTTAAAAVVGANSYFVVNQLGNSSTVYAGNWT
jgi:hypothetical protein